MDKVIKPVSWTKRSTKDLEKIVHYNTDQKGKKRSQEIALGIQKTTEILENPEYNFKNIGTVDDQFTH